MTLKTVPYREQLLEEINKTPEEYLPTLLELIRVFRRGVALKPAAISFEQGWQEAIAGDTWPVSELWDGIDGE